MAGRNTDRPEGRLRNAGNLRCLAADKEHDEMSFRESLRVVGVRLLIKHRVFASYEHANNAHIDDNRYHQRSTSESVNSPIKHSHGSAVRACDWFRQFREIALIAGDHNVEQAIDA